MSSGKTAAEGRDSGGGSDANAAPASIPETTSRLVAALAAKVAADATAQRDASAKTCLANCRALLQAQIDAATSEVDAARAELAERKDRGGARNRRGKCGYCSPQNTRVGHTSC